MADLDDLLEKTSRTFALSIPLLPEPTRREVAVAYLLFRIADTFEDATHWPRESRLTALHEFAALLSDPAPERCAALAEAWVEAAPTSHAGYQELLARVPSVLEDFLALRPPAVTVVRDHLIRSAMGMADFVGRMEGHGDLKLSNLAELKAYCYAVAGIVGEMLTELFLLGSSSLSGTETFFRERAAAFGEALQLVNILKDSGSDLLEGRRYVPDGVGKSELFALARRDLKTASEYVLKLQSLSAPRGLVGFTALPVQLAWAALEKVEKHGPGSKVSRPEVYLITRRLNRALDRNDPAVPVG
jgi:farnesyl-diphosphate farnesyltransferase